MFFLSCFQNSNIESDIATALFRLKAAVRRCQFLFSRFRTPGVPDETTGIVEQVTKRPQNIHSPKPPIFIDNFTYLPLIEIGFNEKRVNNPAFLAFNFQLDRGVKRRGRLVRYKTL